MAKIGSGCMAHKHGFDRLKVREFQNEINRRQSLPDLSCVSGVRGLIEKHAKSGGQDRLKASSLHTRSLLVSDNRRSRDAGILEAVLSRDWDTLEWGALHLKDPATRRKCARAIPKSEVARHKRIACCADFGDSSEISAHKLTGDERALTHVIAKTKRPETIETAIRLLPPVPARERELALA